MTNYNNFLNRSICAFFSERFYNFVAKGQKNSGFGTLVVILFFTYLIPSVVIYNKLINFSYEDSESALELKSMLLEVPEITITEGVLDDNDIFPKSISSDILNKNFLVIDKKENSLVASNSSILFSKDGVYFNNLELVVILLNTLNLKNIPTGNITNNTNFVPYPAEFSSFDSNFLIQWSEKYIHSLGASLVYSLLPAVVLLSIILKFVEIFFLSFITRIISVRMNLNLSSNQIFRLTVAAMIPALMVKLINGMSLWSSKILSVQPMGTLLLVAMNLYFIYFSVKSVRNSK